MYTNKKECAQAIKANGGYCPCKFEKNEDTVCPCKEYRTTGECECGMFEPKIRFEFVSSDQYDKDYDQTDAKLSLTPQMDQYVNIVLPSRATEGSAGYDFVLPYVFTFYPDQRYVLPTGIRCRLPKDKVLIIMPRSSMGFKYGMRLNNTIGVIDSDYYNADNEGHILLAITVDKPVTVKAGERICQGIILSYYTAFNDEPRSTIRTGGIGSTGV